MKKIYLDYAASTPLDPKALAFMMPYLKKKWGNPSSVHSFGQEAAAAIEKAREQVAQFLNCKPLEVVFTSGATEANNLAIRGVIEHWKLNIGNGKPHVIVSQIEHESVLSPCQELEGRGIAEVTYVVPDKEGVLQTQDIEKAIKANTVLVSVMYANSEIGTAQPITEIGRLLESFKIQDARYKILFHTDAVQAAPFLDCDVQKLGADLVTLSGHKIYGPKGVGVLYVKEGTPLFPLLLGGGQEQGLRSGTENVAAIAGMGAAVEELQDPKAKIQNIKTRQLRDMLIKEVLKRIPRVSLTGSLAKRLPNNAHFRFEGVMGKDLVIALDQKGIAASTGSACSEKTEQPSHVLLALGLHAQEALSSLRLTLGKHTTKEEIEYALKVLAKTVAQLRRERVQ